MSIEKYLTPEKQGNLRAIVAPDGFRYLCSNGGVVENDTRYGRVGWGLVYRNEGVEVHFFYTETTGYPGAYMMVIDPAVSPYPSEQDYEIIREEVYRNLRSEWTVHGFPIPEQVFTVQRKYASSVTVTVRNESVDFGWATFDRKELAAAFDSIKPLSSTHSCYIVDGENEYTLRRYGSLFEFALLGPIGGTYSYKDNAQFQKLVASL